MRTACATSSRQRGFTLLEVALVVLVMGILLTTLMTMRNQGASRSTASEAAFMDAAVSGLFQYAKRNNRLPCPDLNGDGLEDAVGGICPNGTHSGGIPYLTLELPLSSPVGTGLDRQFVYGVFRGDGDVAKDLTRSAERSVPPHVAPHLSFESPDDFKHALINALNATSNIVSDSNLYVTGNDAGAGVADCASKKVTNVAFVVVSAGASNADQQGTDFDGPNLPGEGWSESTKWESVTPNTCFAGPGKPITARYDDQVRAVSFTELMGFFAQ